MLSNVYTVFFFTFIFTNIPLGTTEIHLTVVSCWDKVNCPFKIMDHKNIEDYDERLGFRRDDLGGIR
jgi:hypothetical protein